MTTRILWLAVIVLHLSACTTLRPIEAASGPLTSDLGPGDRVHITAKDGSGYDFTIARLSADEICGELACVATGDVAHGAKHEFSGWRTAGLVLSIVGSVALLVAFAVAKSGVGLMGAM